MASTSKETVQTSVTVPENAASELEPGACPESILNPTDSFEEFASEMSSSLKDRKVSLTATTSTISEIQNEIGESLEHSKSEEPIKTVKSTDDLQSKDVSTKLPIGHLFEPKPTQPDLPTQCY